MKRVITAVTILVIIISLCSVSLWATYRLTEEMGELLGIAADLAKAGDMDGARLASERAVQWWDFAGPVLSLYIYHNELEHFSADLQKLPIYLEHGKVEDFIMLCENEQAAVQQLLESERPLLHNVF